MLLALILLAGAPLELQRKHTVGQKYSVEYKNDDTQLKVSKTFKGTAVVKAAAPGKATFEVTVDSLEWTTSSGGKRTGKGVKLKVQLDGDSIDAEIVNPGTVGDDAEFELTSFEHLLGDLCQPPAGPWLPRTPIGDWQLVGVSGATAKLRSTPPATGDPFTCDVTVSTEDGFSGERTGLMRVPLEKNAVVEQKHWLKVKRL